MSEEFYERVRENVISKKFLPDKILKERVNYKVLDILGAGRINRFFLKHGIGLKGRLVTPEGVAKRILKERLADNLTEARNDAYSLLNGEAIPINDSSGANIVRLYDDEKVYQAWCGFKRKKQNHYL